MKKLIVAVLIGVALGYIGAKILFVNSGYSLIIWGATSLIIGFNSTNSRQALILGSSFGFALAFSFMAFSYNGAPSLLSRVPFFAVLGAVGAICGLILGLIGLVIRRALSHKTKEENNG